MNYCKPIDENTAERYTLRQLKADNPKIIFPEEFTNGEMSEVERDAMAAEYGAFPYVIPVEPAFNTNLEKLVVGGIINNAGTWIQQWIIIPLSQDELDTLADQAAGDSVRADTALKNFVALGPSGFDSYIDNNVTDLASARSVLKKLSKIVWLGMKDQFPV